MLPIALGEVEQQSEDIRTIKKASIDSNSHSVITMYIWVYFANSLSLNLPSTTSKCQ